MIEQIELGAAIHLTLHKLLKYSPPKGLCLTPGDLGFEVDPEDVGGTDVQ